MTIEQEINMFRDMTVAMGEIFARKRHSYGQTTTETFEKFGPVSMVTRMHDKLGRLDNLLVFNGKNAVVDESVDDTLLDLANYALITILELRKEKERLCSCACSDDQSASMWR